ncbi:MAG: UDP-N-acetyl-D-glucosamine dehydrogenase [Legionellaceae bacterium]|nr:UDP-N-acetyl-D-glucosamine dehydrogenase [Legionellaceae bacterium]
MKNNLLQLLGAKQATIGVVGVGYVGLPLALHFSEAGYAVQGFDIDERCVTKLNSGTCTIRHIKADRIITAKRAGFAVTADMSRISEVDAIIICVPTPLDDYREPDLSFVEATMASIQPFLKKGQVLSFESTTYPGTVEEIIKPYIDSRGFTVGQDFFLVYSPEREDPANVKFNTSTIPKLCAGLTEDCLAVGMALYAQVVKQVVPVSSLRVAEMTKLLENIHRAVNIGLVNEMKMVADKMGIDIFEVINAAATKPFGFVPYYPGPGIGGHCIPIDPFYLTWKAREYGIHTRFIELAGEINNGMPEWVLNKLMDKLNDQGKALRGAKILLLGIAYKKNVDDMRESPAVFLMELLEKKGAKISYHDPFVPEFPRMRKHQFNLVSIELTSTEVESVDAVIIATGHDDVDYALVKKHAKLIVDTRGVYTRLTHNVVRA